MMKVRIIFFVLFWVTVTKSSDIPWNLDLVESDSQPSSPGRQPASTSSAAPASPPVATTINGRHTPQIIDFTTFKDPIDRAVAMSVYKAELSSNAIYSCISELKDEEELLEGALGSSKGSKKKMHQENTNRLQALQYALGNLRINWAERILSNAKEDVLWGGIPPEDVENCIQELQMFISSRAFHVIEPDRIQREKELRIREIDEELAKRDGTKKQLEEDQWVWKKLIGKINEQLEKEKKLLPPPPQISVIDELILSGAPAIQSPLASKPKTVDPEKIQAQKKEKVDQIRQLLDECKTLDAQCLPQEIFAHASDDDDDDAESRQEDADLNGYYSRLKALVEIAIEQVPHRETHFGPPTNGETQAKYLNLLVLEKINAEAALASMNSLIEIGSDAIKNREALRALIVQEREYYSQEYTRLHDELESQKLLLVRLKVLAGKTLGDFERQRFLKYTLRKKDGDHESH